MRSRFLMLLWIRSLGALAWASLSPRLAPPGEHHLDKLIHLVVYALLALPPALALARRAALGCGLALTLLGIAIEIAQGYVPGRQGSPADALVNLAGVALGLVAGLALRRAWRGRAAMSAQNDAGSEGLAEPGDLS
jgi:VanZ family protein